MFMICSLYVPIEQVFMVRSVYIIGTYYICSRFVLLPDVLGLFSLPDRDIYATDYMVCAQYEYIPSVIYKSHRKGYPYSNLHRLYVVGSFIRGPTVL